MDTRIFTAIGLDFETGGLDCTRHACTQIALQAIRLDTLETTDRYTVYIAPYDKQEISRSKRKVLKPRWELQLEFTGSERMEYEQKALDYSGITMEMLSRQGINIRGAAQEIIAFAVRNTFNTSARYKPFLIGQNIAFDIGFLQQLMNYAGLVGEFEKTFAGTKDFYGNFQPSYLDTVQLAKLAFAHDASLASYKLELVAAHLGIDLADAHDAEADISATMDIVRMLSGKMRSGQSSDEAVIRQKENLRTYFKI